MNYQLLRHRARARLSGNWGLAIGAAAVAFLLANVGNSFIPALEWVEEPALELTENLRITFHTGLLGVIAFIIGGTVELGYVTFLLHLHDQKEPRFNDLFSRFDRFGTGFAQAFLRGLYIALWSLLLIVPGIVKSYSYAMTPYILAENPDMTANEAITRSREMMDGHKGELFILELTFIGWSLLASLAWNLGYLVLNPYTAAARTAFYRELTAVTVE